MQFLDSPHLQVVIIVAAKLIHLYSKKIVDSNSLAHKFN